MAKAKRQHEEEHENHERWLLTYADMITLLMTLFIVLYAMSTVDAAKFKALADSFQGEKSENSVLKGSESVIDGGVVSKLDKAAEAQTVEFDTPSLKQAATAALASQTQAAKAKKQEDDNLEQAKQEIQAALGARGLADTVRFRREPKGLVVTIVTDQVLFDSGRAEVKPAGARVLEALGEPINQLPNPVNIEGHTDNIPIKSAQFPTNWELSTTRATSVLRFLADQEDVATSRLSAAGYADQRPLVPNDSAEHRAANRRVEVVIQSMVGQAQTTTSETTATTAPVEAVTPNLPTLPSKPKIELPQASAKEEHP